MTWVEGMTYSRNQTKQAGKLLRRHELANDEVPDDQRIWALGVLNAWRQPHGYPLTKATMALRKRLQTKSLEGDAAQRLKRRGTIIGKLVRHPRMQLTTMQDVAGCRIVLEEAEAVHIFMDGWRVRERLVSVDDYVSQPQPSGYRALHWVVEYDGLLVEMQIRTAAQHKWAVGVEQIGASIGCDLKSGVGPEPVLEWLAAVAEVFAYVDAGRRHPSSLELRVMKLRAPAASAAREHRRRQQEG